MGPNGWFGTAGCRGTPPVVAIIEPIAPLGTPDSAFPAKAPTSEAAWATWATDLDALVVDAARVVVIAPHPDDETLGCGGLIHDLVEGGSQVQVVTVTDGEASHRSWPELASLRRREQREALGMLGVPASPTFLGVADGTVAEHRDQVAAALRGVLDDVDLVLAPWSLDGHSDHDAVGRIAAEVTAGPDTVLLAHPVWAWQWAIPGDLSGLRWCRYDLEPTTRHTKVDALSSHRSQLTERNGPAVLVPEVRDRAGRPYEVHARVG